MASLTQNRQPRSELEKHYRVSANKLTTETPAESARAKNLRTSSEYLLRCYGVDSA